MTGKIKDDPDQVATGRLRGGSVGDTVTIKSMDTNGLQIEITGALLEILEETSR